MPDLGKREQRKRETFEAIVRAASQLFDEKGFKETSVEDVADVAGVSPATVYNYFGTKGSILVVIATRATQASASANIELEDASGDPVPGVLALIDAYVESFLSLDVEVIKEVFRSAFQPAHGLLLDEMTLLDTESVAILESVYMRLQAAGEIDAAIDASHAAWLTFSTVMAAVLLYVVRPEIGIEGVKGMVHDQIEILFRGLLPR